MHKAKKKTISTYHKKNHTKMSNNASKYSAEDEQTSKVSARSKSVLLYSAAFLLAELMMLFILKANHFYPFGTKSMLIMDMRDQNVEFLASLRSMIHGDNSLFFSWARSMGGNYMGVFAFYISSPLSFLTLLFPVSKMPVAIEIITVLKIGLCSLTFVIYANYLRRKYNGQRYFALLIPAIGYAFMSYTMVYSLSIMWLDGVIFLPLVLLGAEKILDGKRGICFIICYALLCMSNYYTGYMVGIFTGLYFLIMWICNYNAHSSRQHVSGHSTISEVYSNKEHWKRLLHFVIAALLAVAMTAPILLPALKALMSGKLDSGFTGYEPQQSTNFVFKNLFTKLLPGKYDSITNSGLPSIYPGLLLLLLAVIYFLLRQIKLREKIGMAAMLILFAISFYYIPLDKVWHGFQYPNWFPYRYAFLCSFTLIYMALRSIMVITQLVHKKYVLLAAITLCLLGTIIDMTGNGRKMFDGLDKEFGYTEMAEYTKFIKETQTLVQKIQKQDKDLYRINQTYEFSKNDAMLLGYNGMTHYSSAFNVHVNKLTKTLGLAQSYFWNSGYGSTPLTDSLFGCKYVLSRRDLSAVYATIDSKDNTLNDMAASYQNNMALPFAYAVSDLRKADNIAQQSVFSNENSFVTGITGKHKNYFWNCNVTYSQEAANTWTYQITAASNNPMYLYMEGNSPYANVYVNGTYIGDYFSNETNCILYLGNFKQNETVTVQVVTTDDGNTYGPSYAEIVQLDMATVRETMQSLAGNALQVKSHSHGKITGSITLADDQQAVMTSIPYDKGWTILVDGKKVNYTTYADTFMQFKCSPGKHTVEFRYVSPGFKLGILIAVIGLFAAILYLCYPKILSRR